MKYFLLKITSLGKKDSGQALLIGLLVMAVALTIGLSIISRSITDIRISQQEEESARAFSVAEAGIEASLKAGQATDVTIGDVTAVVKEIGLGNDPVFEFPTEVDEGDASTVWLVWHNDEGVPDSAATGPGGEGRYAGTAVDLYWGNEDESPDSATTPALEVTFYYQDAGGDFKVKRGAFDPYSPAGGGDLDRDRLGNNFDDADAGGPFSPEGTGRSYRYRRANYLLDIGGGIPYALRLKLIYNTNSPQALAVIDNGVDQSFPSQGDCYESTASIEDPNNPEDRPVITRRVEQCQFHKALPEIFDYALFSEGDLVK